MSEREERPVIRPVDPEALGIADPHRHIDTTVASPARMYDYALGGKDNFPADRDAAEKVIAAYPQTRQMARQNRGFLVRAVERLARDGVDQYLDLGTGIPTSPNVHEVARAIRPDARIVYVDNDPIVTVHNRALRTRETGVVAVEADVRDPAAVLGHPGVQAALDFTRPIAVLAVALFHFIPDAEPIVAAYRDAVTSGGFLAISAASSDGLTEGEVRAGREAYAGSSVPLVLRSRAEFTRLFDGTELVPPGVVPAGRWGADEPETHPRILAGLARIP